MTLSPEGPFNWSKPVLKEQYIKALKQNDSINERLKSADRFRFKLMTKIIEDDDIVTTEEEIDRF